MRSAAARTAGRPARARISRRGAPAAVRLLEHTADAAIEVQGRSPEECFALAAAGMFATFVMPAPGTWPEESIEVELNDPEAGDRELLLRWLEELLYQSAVRDLALLSFEVDAAAAGHVAGRASGRRFGAGVVPAGPGVKAVTHHRLKIWRAAPAWRARVVFDV